MTTINLALAGGGLKSYAQIAVLHELEKQEIKINAVAGTSMGSCIAALVAIGLDAKTIEKEMLEMERFFQDNKIFLKPSMKLLPFSSDKIEGGYVDGLMIEEKLEALFAKYDVHKISDVKKPLAINAVDLTTGKMIVFVSDKDKYETIDIEHVVESEITLAKAVRASSSIPFVFSHVMFKDFTLVDGGVKLNVPLPLLKGFSNHQTLAVTTKKEIDPLENPNIFSLALQVYNINSTEFDLYVAKEADHYINVPLGRLQFSVGKGQEIIDKSKQYISNNNYIENIKKDKKFLPFDKFF